jgi:DNA mismatch endonuclease (patch repair protein)
MLANQGKNTRPEGRLRAEFDARNFHYEMHKAITTGSGVVTVDFAFRKQRVAVMADGCFWHRCTRHRTIPRAHHAWWAAKLARTVARDSRQRRALRRDGWIVLRVWEHESVMRASARVERALAPSRF